MKMKKQKNKKSDSTHKVLKTADSLIMWFFGAGVLIIIALFIYVLTHESL